jgi:UDP-N-acetyl-D-glucosamine dehydrogenase
VGGLKKIITKLRNKKASVAIIGLGYVGLPLAVAFAKAGFKVLGVDIDTRRVGSIKERVLFLM